MCCQRSCCKMFRNGIAESKDTHPRCGHMAMVLKSAGRSRFLWRESQLPAVSSWCFPGLGFTAQRILTAPRGERAVFFPCWSVGICAGSFALTSCTGFLHCGGGGVKDGGWLCSASETLLIESEGQRLAGRPWSPSPITPYSPFFSSKSFSGFFSLGHAWPRRAVLCCAVSNAGA